MEHFLVVGLGNHNLDNTRHNAGARVVERLAARLQLNWSKSTKHTGGYVCTTIVDNNGEIFKLTLLKPKAFMNANGASVVKTANLLSIAISNVFLIHDELELSLGQFKIQKGGSARGHNGVLSCINCLRSDKLSRLRIGISRPVSRSNSEVASYVLGKFYTEELPVIENTIEQAVAFLLQHLEQRASGVV